MTNDDFPLIANGSLIYGRMNSSPVLTANSMQDAERVVAMLNEMHSIRLKVIANGPTLVGDLTDQGHNW